MCLCFRHAWACCQGKYYAIPAIFHKFPGETHIWMQWQSYIFFHLKSLNIILKKVELVLQCPKSAKQLSYLVEMYHLFTHRAHIFIFFITKSDGYCFFFSPLPWHWKYFSYLSKFYRSFKLTSSSFQNFPFSLIDCFFKKSCFPWLSYLSFCGLETLSWNGVPITHLLPMHNLWQLPFAL